MVAAQALAGSVACSAIARRRCISVQAGATSSSGNRLPRNLWRLARSIAICTTRKRRRRPLARSENVPLTLTCPVSLKADLETCAVPYAQAYGEVVDGEQWIPHMLETFMAGNRGFSKGMATRSAPWTPTRASHASGSGLKNAQPPGL